MPTLWEAERRHAAHYAGLLRELQEAYRDGDHDAAVNRFEQDWDQLRKGQAWATAELDRGGEGRWLVQPYAAFGHNLLRLRRPPSELIRWLDPALSITSEIGDAGMRAEKLNLRAAAAYDQGKFGDALLFYDRALAELSQEDAAGDDPEYVTMMRGGILRNLAASYQRMGSFEEAVARYEESLAIARRRGDRREEGSILGNLGISYAEHDDDERAVSYYRQALDIATEIHDESERDLWLGNLGNSYVSLGRLQDGVDHLEQALAIARGKHDRAEEGIRLGGLGSAYLSLDQPERARQYIEQALAIAREMGSAYSEAIEIHRLGLVHLRLGQNDEAVHCFGQAAERFEALGLAPLADRSAKNLRVARGCQADELFNLGSEHLRHQRWPEAIDAYTRGWEISGEIGDQRRESEILGHLGFAEQAVGRLDLAESHFRDVIEVDSQLDDIKLRAHHILNLANVYHQRDELEAARERYVEALAMLDPEQDRELAANSFANLGAIDAHRGRLAEARGHYQKASEAYAALGMADLVERVQQDLADLGGGAGMDERTASELGLFLMNEHLSGSVAGLTVVFTNGSAVSARLAAIALGQDFPQITVALPDGRVGRLDLSAVSLVTVRLTDGGTRVFGEEQDPATP
jgi:tetratricopeptide (TPR) repeat protein